MTCTTRIELNWKSLFSNHTMYNQNSIELKKVFFSLQIMTCTTRGWGRSAVRCPSPSRWSQGGRACGSCPRPPWSSCSTTSWQRACLERWGWREPLGRRRLFNLQRMSLRKLLTNKALFKLLLRKVTTFSSQISRENIVLFWRNRCQLTVTKGQNHLASCHSAEVCCSGRELDHDKSGNSDWCNCQAINSYHIISFYSVWRG